MSAGTYLSQPDGLRLCRKCGIAWPPTDFYNNNRGGLDNICKWHRNLQRSAATKIKYERLKDLVLDHYSNFCQCCHEMHREFLTIDHINGRASMDHGRFMTGLTLYSWIVKNNYPSGLRVLCYNCNLATRWGRKCPHESEKNQRVES